MSTHFRVVALARETFEPLFALDDAALRARHIERRMVEEAASTPCRVSLEDAQPGERVLLLPYLHHDVATPYRASGPIFVREHAVTAQPAIDTIPAMLVRRLLSVRAYDRGGMLQASEVIAGPDLAEHVRARFAEPTVEYLHVHNARPGCFNCRIERA
jgi:hypothetical protein